MKNILSVLASLALVGCSYDSAEILNIAEPAFKYVCLDGIVYHIGLSHKTYKHSGYGFMSPKFNKDGSLEGCN